MKNNEVRLPFRIFAGIIGIMGTPISILILLAGFNNLFQLNSIMILISGISMASFSIGMLIVSICGRLPKKFAWILDISKSTLDKDV